MTFADHFLNFVFYGSLWTLCFLAILGLVRLTAKGNRARHRKAEAHLRQRREEVGYPKKTSASA